MDDDVKQQSEQETKSQIDDADYDMYLNWKSAHYNNERQYLLWIRTSIAMLTLGFIIEQLYVFLHRQVDNPLQNLSSFSIIAHILFLLAGFVVILSTWEYFRERKSINQRSTVRGRNLPILVISTLILLLAVAVLLILPM